MEMLRTLKGSSTGEVSVHLVASDSPGSGPHLPTTAFIIPASSATLGLPSSTPDVSCFPRESIHVGAPERVSTNEPVMATVLPQLTTVPAGSSSATTVRLLEWTETAAPPPGSSVRGRGLAQGSPSSDPPSLQFRISEYAAINMVETEQPPNPQPRQEGVAKYEDGGPLARGGDAGTQQPGRSPRSPGPARALCGRCVGGA